MEHIISAFPMLAKEQYIKRHDRVCSQLHFDICKETEVKLDSEHWNEHLPESLKTSHAGKVTILWNQQVWTDRTIPNNKLNIIIRGNKKGTRMSVDVAISGDRNVIKKEAEKN
jgi:flagellar hook assembly protein FlgD